MDIVFATQNKGKINELKKMFSTIGFNVLSMAEVGFDLDIEENGETFEENAMIKAKALYNALPKNKYLIMADDSGIEIEALNNKPGVYSARYNGVDTPWPIKNKLILDEIGDNENRKARFVACIAVILQDGSNFVEKGIVEGNITTEIIGEEGFGYDPIFIPLGHNKTFAQMSSIDKGKISHRGNAISQVKEKLQKLNF